MAVRSWKMRLKEAQGELQQILAEGSIFREFAEPPHRIGRVTEGLLLHVAKEVDIIEPIPKFTLALHGKPGIRSIQNISMSAWRPDPLVSYGLVWIQWCLGYLTDEELLEHLGHCKSALKSPDGLIVIKKTSVQADRTYMMMRTVVSRGKFTCQTQ